MITHIRWIMPKSSHKSTASTKRPLKRKQRARALNRVQCSLLSVHIPFIAHRLLLYHLLNIYTGSRWAALLCSLLHCYSGTIKRSFCESNNATSLFSVLNISANVTIEQLNVLNSAPSASVTVCQLNVLKTTTRIL